VDWRIVSIGTLASHPLWNESGLSRTGHATTTVVKSDNEILLVDPSLPPQVIDARLQERWGFDLSAVTHVFLTSFDPDRRRTLHGLSHASWFMHEPEIAAATNAVQDELHRAEGDDELSSLLETHLDLLSGFNAAPDTLLHGTKVDLFPLPGYTQGSCGLLLPTPSQTVLICGDTVATREHLAQASVLPNCIDIDLAQESFKECVEIADVIIPGRDNTQFYPTR
jgi:glyoxylase-like metal-dependent hydrolase (beta-lactamase superfamily II)